MSLSTDVLAWALAAGVAQAAFLTVALLTLRTRNGEAARWLAVLNGFLGAMLFGELLDISEAGRDWPLGLVLEFALPPALYQFVRAAIAPVGSGRPRHVALHFVPLACAALAVAVLLGRAGEHSIGIAHPQLGTAVVALVLLKSLSFATYGAISVCLLLGRLRSSKRRERPRLRHLLSWLGAVLFAVFLSYAALLAQVIGYAPLGDADTLGALVSVGVIFFFGYYVLSHPDALNRPPPSSPPASANAKETRQVVALLAERQPHLDPEFTLQAFSEQTGLAPDTIRRAIDSEHQMEVGEYITAQRLASFCALAQDPANTQRTALELALDAGFPSKATFYRAFAAAYGTSPAAYRKSLLTASNETSQSAT
ncbi:MAG: AraC family transcriptional regulator [Pseudomonadota bacterium]